MSAAVVSPRLAASLILIRDGSEGVEVLMVERAAAASYAAGKFVFPGGAVDAADSDYAGPEASLRVAAIRETLEECGLLLAAAEPVELSHASDFASLVAAGCVLDIHSLIPFAHWITPLHAPKRFDTHFFLTRAPMNQTPAADLREVVSAVWLQPGQVVAAAEAAELNLMMATYMNLRWLARHRTVANALDAARGRSIVTVCPEPIESSDGRIYRIQQGAGYGESEVPEKRFRR